MGDNLLVDLAALSGAAISVATVAALVYRRAAKVAALHATISKIAEQFKPNHGTSLRDVVDRIERQTVIVQAVQRAVLQVQDYAIVETDAAGQLVWANRVYLTLVGMTLPEVKGKGWINAIHEEDRERVVSTWIHAVEDQRDVEMRFCVLTATIPQPVHAKCYTLRDHAGKAHGWIGLIHKIECDDRDDPRCDDCRHKR